MQDIELWFGDCLELMNNISDKSVDMILADLPYGTTACKWDTIIPFEPLWKQYKRIINENGAIVLFGNQPFTSLLISSNLGWFKYSWVWDKNRAGNFVSANYQPMKVHEDICVFGKFPITYNPKKIKNYNPQMVQGLPYSRGKINNVVWNGRNVKAGHIHNNKSGLRYPTSIIEINKSNNKSLHTQEKPINLLEYLIKTYTNESDLVLDNVMGSGSTGVASINTNRRFIGIEKDAKYFEIARKRIGGYIK